MTTGSLSSQTRTALSELRVHYAGPSGRRRIRRIVTMGLLSVLVFGVYIAIGPSRFVEGFQSVVETAQAHPIIFGAGLFLLWTALFLTVAPLGSVTVMTAGFVFGPAIGVLQAAAQLTASIILYIILPKPTSNIFRGSLILTFVRQRPIVFVGAIRLVPILPSAVSVIAYRELGISLRHMIVGTLLVGWIRPVSLAWAASKFPDIQALFERLYG